ncbi:amino acid transporter [Niveomyces insectorum RCEF 264]|uniref:Amino acid transporter n=1 Tax=Niveomyces insectorum RCEF 264 TaxID=1081102 RepID=A0A167T4T4_9HYPO|nr:amino acid transporter [Niveomyces insectorum RCEF 264]
MPNYSTISSDPGRASPDDMTRRRRARSPKSGGGEASMLSSNVNLLNTIVGAGTLAMPAAMSHMSVTLGTVVILWSGLTSAFGLYLQARCARYLDRGTSSFFALSQITYPNAAVVFDAAIAIKCFGVGVSYLIIIGDLMPGVALGFNSDAASVPFLVDRNFWITAFMLVIIPLAFLRRLDSLKYTSLVALVSIGYLIVLVVYHFASDSPAERGEVRIFAWGGPVAMLSSLPVVVFAYTCHQNMFSILNEIKDNSPASIVGVIGSSIGSAALIYTLVAVTGYLTFGSHVVGNIVSMYPPNTASTIGKAAIVVLVMFSVPLQIHPCRASLDAVLKWRPNKAGRGQAPLPSAAGLPTGSSNNALLLPIAAPTDSYGAPAAPLSDLRFALLTTFIIVLSYTTALSVSSLDRVLAYVGSTGSTSISFILPGLFYYKISDPDSIHHQRLTKEDDDAVVTAVITTSGSDNDESDEETELDPGEQSLLSGVPSLAPGAGAARRARQHRNRRTWRWDLEHLEHGLLRKLALCLAIYGVCVMVLCILCFDSMKRGNSHKQATYCRLADVGSLTPCPGTWLE